MAKKPKKKVVKKTAKKVGVIKNPTFEDYAKELRVVSKEIALLEDKLRTYLSHKKEVTIEFYKYLYPFTDIFPGVEEIV